MRWFGFDWREDARACMRSLRVRGAARLLLTRSAVVTKVLRNFMVAVVNNTVVFENKPELWRVAG